MKVTLSGCRWEFERSAEQTLAKCDPYHSVLHLWRIYKYWHFTISLPARLVGDSCGAFGWLRMRTCGTGLQGGSISGLKLKDVAVELRALE